MGSVRRATTVVGVFILVFAMAGVTTSKRQPVRHDVGGKGGFGWKTDQNYTDWSLNRHFYVGDWLYFFFDRHRYNVLQVNKTSYESCNEKDPIMIVSRGAGRDVFELKEAISYYFISGGGYCWHSARLAVQVENPPSEPPVESPSSSPPASNASSTSFGIFPIAFPLIISFIFKRWS